MAKPLSKTDQARLLAAIEKTAQYVNDGYDPNEAVAAAVKDHGVPAGHISPMVHAYNTGRTTRQRVTGDSVLEKAADFELADIDRVRELLYPTEVKTAAAREQATAVDVTYALPPTGVLERHQRLEKLAASLAVNWRKLNGVEITPPPAYPREPTQAMKRAYCQAQQKERRADEARRQMRAAFDKLAEDFAALTDYFRSPSSLPLTVVREQAALVYGDKGEQLMDELVKVTPGLRKMSRAVPAGPIPWVGAPFDLIDRIVDGLADYREKRAAYEQISHTARRDMEALLRPFAPRVPESILGGALSTDSEKQAGTLTDILAPVALGSSIINNFRRATKPKDTAQLEQQALEQLTDPEHEATLRNIRAQSALQGLLATDPIISQQPQEALDAYNEIVEASPRAADQTMLLRSLLRQRLTQGNLDAFQLDQILGMEDKLRKRDTSLGVGTPVTGPQGDGHGRATSVLD